MSSITWSAGLDGSRFISGTKDMKNAVTDTGKLVEEVFGRKLKQVISVVAIEQATQRTAEWAQQIEQTSKNLGTTAEQLQTLNHIASATGTSEQAVQGLFDNIQKGAQDAIKGNGDLIASFAKLGLSVGDLMSMDNAKIFSKVMSSIPANVANSKDQYLRQSVQNITGTPENTLNSIKAGYEAQPGDGLGGKAKGLSDSGAIGDEASIKELSTVWSEVTTSLKEAGISLIPVATILLSIVKTLTDALGGVSVVVNGFADFVKGDFRKGFGKIIGVAVGATESIDSVVSPGSGGVVSWLHEKALGYFGIKNDLAIGKGKAVGDTAVMIGAGGESLIGGLGSYALRGTAAGAGKVGIRGVAEWASVKAENIDKELMDTYTDNNWRDIRAKARVKVAAEDVIGLRQQKALDAAGITIHKITPPEIGPAQQLSERDSMYGTKDGQELNSGQMDSVYKMLKAIAADGYKGIPELSKGWKEGIQPAEFATMAVKVGMTTATNLNKINKDPNASQSQNIKPIGVPMGFTQMPGGGPSLKMGGLFGVGSIGDKLVDLNKQMAGYLSTIAQNSSHNNHATMYAPATHYRAPQAKAGGV